MLHLLLIAVVYAQKYNDTIRIQTPEYEQNLNNSRNIFYSCIITSTSYLTQSDESVQKALDTIMEAYLNIEAIEIRFQTQQEVWKRIQLDAVKHCSNKQTVTTAKQMYEELHGEGFNITKYFYLMNGFQLEPYYNQTANLEFDKDEETLWDIMEDFQAKSRQNAPMDDEDFDAFDMNPDFMDNPYETQVFGQSIDKSSNLSIIIFISVGVVFTVIMVFAYQALKDSHKVDAKKQKKIKKQK